MPEFVLSDDRIANKTPASTFEAPVSFLRFEPQVDLQTRNFGEAQGDIAIRGGIFEGTAVQVGGMSLFDPQTGHYTAELPIPPAMLAAPSVRTGFAHALDAMQATVGTIAYGWRRLEAGGEASLAVGNGEFDRQSIYAADVIVDDAKRGRQIGVDASWSRSAADGTIANGDHEFERFAGRIQVISPLGQTDLFAGYQDKFFGWPNLYTPFGWPETEHLQTELYLISHRQQVGDGTLELGLQHRRNDDDYEVDRRSPGLFNAYQHQTQVTAGFMRYHTGLGAWRLDLRADVAADALESTSLRFGHFMSRTYLKLAAAAGREFDLAGGVLAARGGVTWDETNRDGSSVSPLAEISWIPAAGLAGATPRVYAEYAQASRVPGYTALNSNPRAGLFRGNPDLGREKSRNAEVGAELRATSWSAHLALFRRLDDPLVDWTFTPAAHNARTANAVAIDTTGIELLVSRKLGAVDAVLGYAWLTKDATYRAADVEASFYALNFPLHRATFALVGHLGAGFEVRCDNEYRVQEKNTLRTAGGDSAFLTSVGLGWTPPRFDAIEISVVVDNLWEDDFQELPSVPAPGRQVTAGVAYRW